MTTVIIPLEQISFTQPHDRRDPQNITSTIIIVGNSSVIPIQLQPQSCHCTCVTSVGYVTENSQNNSLHPAIQ